MMGAEGRMGGKKEKRGALVVAGMARFVFRVSCLAFVRSFTCSSSEQSSSLSVADEAARSLNGGACAVAVART